MVFGLFRKKYSRKGTTYIPAKVMYKNPKGKKGTYMNLKNSTTWNKKRRRWDF